MTDLQSNILAARSAVRATIAPAPSTAPTLSSPAPSTGLTFAERVSAAERPIPVDSARTTRSHAGESISDRRNWIGYVLIMAGVVALSLGLVAAAGGFGGWVLLLFPATAALFAFGLVAVLVVRSRVKSVEGRSLFDPSGH